MKRHLFLGTAVAALLAGLWIASFAIVPVAASGQEPDPTRRNLDEYRLRVGDRCDIVVYNAKKLTEEIKASITVPGNGVVSFPPIGKVQLLDRTVFEVQEYIAQKLKDDQYLTDPNVGCVITYYEPRTVFLMGAVQGEVTLPVHRNMRILEVLARAGSLGSMYVPRGNGGVDTSGTGGGGVSVGRVGDFSRVRVRRTKADGTSFPIEVNVEEILDKNQNEQNIVIFENDIIIVPMLEGANPQSAEWVYVLGKVRNPGRQPIIKGRSTYTLTKLVALCGDFLEFANRNKIRIIRTTPQGRVPYVVDFDDIIENEAPDFELKADDLVFVPENWI